MFRVCVCVWNGMILDADFRYAYIRTLLLDIQNPKDAKRKRKE